MEHRVVELIASVVRDYTTDLDEAHELAEDIIKALKKEGVVLAIPIFEKDRANVR